MIKVKSFIFSSTEPPSIERQIRKDPGQNIPGLFRLDNRRLWEPVSVRLVAESQAGARAIVT